MIKRICHGKMDGRPLSIWRVTIGKVHSACREALNLVAKGGCREGVREGVRMISGGGVRVVSGESQCGLLFF